MARVGVIGGGLMGVSLAYFLAQTGEQVTILEQGSELGGLNGELRFEDGLRVARYQHAILPSDQTVVGLCAELGLTRELIFQSAHTGFIHDRRIYPMTTILDFLTFPMLSLADRFRLGRMILHARRQSDWRPLDPIPVKQWLLERGGSETFERVWKPLLEAKFDGVYDNVSATYILAWLNRMSAVRRVPELRTSVGYLQRGHYSLIQALAEAFLKRGGQIKYEVRVREIEVNGEQTQRVRTQEGVLQFDALVAAIPTPTFSRLIPGAESSYLDRLDKAKYLGLICPVMVLDRPLSSYWTLNLTDPAYPFATIIETPHHGQPDHHIVYLPRYTAPDNDWMGVSDDVIREAWLSHLKLIFPDFSDSHIRHFAVSRSRYVEPVYSVNSLANNPDIHTPYKGLYLVNSAQVYPQLPTSEATVVHARKVAEVIRRETISTTTGAAQTPTL